MIRSWLIGLVVCALSVAGCGSRERVLALQADPGNPKSLVEIDLIDTSPAFGGTGEFTLVLRNSSGGRVDDIEIVFDGSWRAPLRNLFTMRVPDYAMELVNRSHLRAGEILVFRFAPGVGNHGVCLDPTGATLPDDRLPGRIAAESAQGRALWDVPR